jgi:hypothetical protein
MRMISLDSQPRQTAQTLSVRHAPARKMTWFDPGQCIADEYA